MTSTTTDTAQCGEVYLIGVDGREHRCDQPSGHDGLHGSQSTRPCPDWCTRADGHIFETILDQAGGEVESRPHTVTLDDFYLGAFSIQVEVLAEEFSDGRTAAPQVQLWFERASWVDIFDGGLSAEQARELGDRLGAALHAAADRLEEIQR